MSRRKSTAEVPVMTAATAGILFGSDTSIDRWIPRQTSNTLELPADMTVSRLEILARIEWVMGALEEYPTTPELPDLELSMPMPSWEAA